MVNQIKEKLTSNLSRMIVLIALPGMGKTEVVIRVGGLLVKEHWPVVYVKEKKLIDICQEILYQVDYRHWTVPMSKGDEISHCKRKLSELEDETIIILDNAEDLQKEEEFNDFFEHLVRSAPKVRTIIATRYDITSVILASIHMIRLDPLDLSSSSKLLMQLAPQISRPHAEEIGDLCGGVPLFLVCCGCSMLADGFCLEVFIRELRKNPVRVIRDNEHLNLIYTNIGRFLRLLPEQVLRNLVRLSVFPSRFSVEDIRFLFEDDYEAEAVKTKMIQCCLLKKLNDGDFFTIHPLVKTYCKAERKNIGMVKEGRSAENAFNHHYLQQTLRDLHNQFLTKDLSLEAIQKFREDKANIMEAFENCLCDTSELKDKVFAVDVANEVVDFLAKVLSPPMDCTTLYQKCCEIARDSDDRKRLAYSLNSLGFRCLDDAAHCKSHGAERACENFEEARSIFCRLPEEALKCEKYAHVTSKLGLCVLLQVREVCFFFLMMITARYFFSCNISLCSRNSAVKYQEGAVCFIFGSRAAKG